MRFLTAAVALLAAAPSAPPAPARELAAAAGGRPTLVHVVQAACACSVRAAPQVDRLRLALGPKVRAVVLIDASPEAAARWARVAGLGFEVCADPDGARIRALEVDRSLTTLLLDAEGRELGRWRGHAAAHLTAAAAAAASAAGMPAPVLDVADAPSETVAGCTFPSR